MVPLRKKLFEWKGKTKASMVQWVIRESPERVVTDLKLAQHRSRSRCLEVSAKNKNEQVISAAFSNRQTFSVAPQHL